MRLFRSPELWSAGLYQIKVVVPSAASRDQPAIASANGVLSPAAPAVMVQ